MPVQRPPSGLPQGGDTGPLDLFDPDRLLTVSIEVAANDWETLRRQTRNVFETLSGDCLARPFRSPFTWFPAAVTVDGVRLADIRIRKKGFVGSLSTVKPALRLDFDRNRRGQEIFRRTI
jgi:spore coat protein CotH